MSDKLKNRPLAFRLTPATRKKLEDVVKVSGRSLAREVEYQLEKSFWLEETGIRIGERRDLKDVN